MLLVTGRLLTSDPKVNAPVVLSNTPPGDTGLAAGEEQAIPLLASSYQVDRNDPRRGGAALRRRHGRAIAACISAWAVDRDGNVYLADTDNNAVRVLRPGVPGADAGARPWQGVLPKKTVAAGSTLPRNTAVGRLRATLRS
jgi:hypothetical protein